MSRPVSWDDQQAFLAVLEEGSLSAAARRLGVSQPTMRARIEALEAAIGTVLFTRSVHGLSPTEGARALHEAARTMALASDLFLRQASAPPGAASGTVRISVPEFMGVEVLPAMLRALRESHPGIHVELSLSNLQADLMAQEVDVAVRTVEPAQEALVARKAATIPLGLFASADYLARRGMPASIDDLARHDMIGPDRSRSDLIFTQHLLPDMAPQSMALRTDSHPAQIAAMRAGLGIGVAQVPVGARDAVLRRVLPDVTVFRLGVWIVTHESLRRVPRVKAVFDALVSSFREFGRA